MIRTPLRPLARILEARQKGENPDAIERENKRIRHEQMRDASRQRAEGRLLVLGVFFFCAFTVVGARMGVMATTDPTEPRAAAPGSVISATRADIVDRNGNLLATNFETHALYAQPHHMIDPQGAVKKLMAVFPDLNEERLLRDFTGKRKFLWIKKKISPEQMQAVHDIGEPGLLFAPRDMRLYPNGSLAAHIMGGASYGREGVHAAEVIGVAGAEKYFDDYLRDPANGNKPLELSIDMTVQAASERILYGGMKLMNAKGATSVLMDVHTGEVISAVSLPSFDPNDRPHAAVTGDASDSPLFNRSVQGVYELGSVFKIFTAAQAIDLGIATADTVIDTSGPMKVGGFRIGEFRGKNYGKQTVTGIIVHSSNRGTGRLALEIGAERQQEFLKNLGFFEPTAFEIVEASGGKPLLPQRWQELSTVTVSYGHGLSSSPMHLAAGYSAIANGGHKVTPTLRKQSGPVVGPRVMSERAAADARAMLRAVVTEGTASFAEVPGYQIGGKTGTADKPGPRGGYLEDTVIATFASMFPAHDPKYVLIVTLDEPVETSGDKPRRTAGWTAVPVAAEMVRRVAPLLGLRPTVEPDSLADITLSSSN
ncbi:MAG: penicillin-binding protein 2 [Sulfitobacter litoralis]|jgi:cell division protein FtsI (penicillin-binding protein 3)|uniref:Cell division protein FtsI (Penicillin-binding protein 3) n=1 Tax=Sulfitobacter litoralis TaxID=335975 RepID=A0ABY0S3Z3_9RHOB|nr:MULTISPECIES: penicillin-binding protein 2 [Sulfitobacter]MBQ0718412.1 penicillin-binding protein 2 [Sulfitobacter litoralis]MBQ0767490.1 penicillin-binding protein 2 [Sulfitobacter litoralis]MBQ0802732.1 penicillin-binding protein 2 [Sulfitobacter litoralis]MCF7725456.1 penicillin-binding protein 2 [Sulfitobacter sp. M22]MCF7776842.1 penicillin-binding protein 2 [Sulfitobacter sp. M220]|tara:strand:- start:1065 stop:2852 length:1788 start_codon:yes stop_codon:yes gene_type:complete